MLSLSSLHDKLMKIELCHLEKEAFENEISTSSSSLTQGILN